MDQFGVQWPKLKQIARTPELLRLGEAPAPENKSGRDSPSTASLGATVKNVVGLGEISGTGLPGEIGVLVLQVPQCSRAAANGLRQFDVILEVDGKKTDSLRDLHRWAHELPVWARCSLTVWRG
jgi:S1-C subfamily serine protease